MSDTEALNNDTLSENTGSSIRQLGAALDNAAAVVIGAGAGLSSSAGFTYTGARFTEHFQDFIDRYHFTDMYSGGFYPFPSLEEYWAYWSRYIDINRYTDPPKPVYKKLLELVKGKDYFVITTNVDHCFQKAGFDKRRLFYTQGDYGLWQCSKPCHQKTYDNEQAVRRMTAEQKDMLIPSALVPHCPVCGRPMTMNLRADDTFVEDEGWHAARDRYQNFLQSHTDVRTLFFELGCGMNTPGIIKFSFWQFADQRPDAVYACVNLGQAYAPAEIKNKSICIDGDIGNVLDRLGGKYP